MYRFLVFFFIIELLFSCVKGDNLTVLELELLDHDSQKPISNQAVIIGQKSVGAFSRARFDTLQTLYTNELGRIEFAYITQARQVLQYRIKGQAEKGSTCLTITQNILEGIVNKKQINLYTDSVPIALHFSKLKDLYPTTDQIFIKISNLCGNNDVFAYKSYQGSHFNPEIYMNVHTEFRVSVQIFENGRRLQAFGYNITVEDQSFIFNPFE